jgi:hypothetical protein
MKKMKKMKTLALLFLAVIMSSTGLVSCIDEDIDPVVASIYKNQALLLASQAGLLDAQATYETAKAAAENALAAAATANVQIARDELEAAISRTSTDADAAIAAAILLAETELTAQILLAAHKAELEAAESASGILISESASALRIAESAAAIARAEDTLAAAIIRGENADAINAAISAANITRGENADAINAATSESALLIAEIVNAARTAEKDEVLRQAILMNAIAVDAAQVALDEAKLEWEGNMAALARDIATAKSLLADDYLVKYMSAKSIEMLLEEDILTAMGRLSDALLKEMGEGDDVTWAYYETYQQTILDNLQSDLAAQQDKVENLEAILADPTTNASLADELRVEIAANDAAIDEIDILIAQQKALRIPLKAELDAINGVAQVGVVGDSDYVAAVSGLDTQYHDLLQSIINLSTGTTEGSIQAIELAIINKKEKIESHGTDVTNAADDVQDAEDALQEANEDVDNAFVLLGDDVSSGYYTVDAAGVPLDCGILALSTVVLSSHDCGVTKYAPAENLQEVLVNATIDERLAEYEHSAAISALGDLENTIDNLEGSLNNAAVDLNTKQEAYDGGIGAATTLVTTTGTAVGTAQGGVTAAIGVYETWKSRFEGGPTTNGGYYWEDDTVTSSAYADLANDVLGIHTDASGPPAGASYVRVSSWANVTAGADDNVGDNYEPALILTADLPASNITYTPGDYITDTDLANAYPNAGYTTEYFIEVGTDDDGFNNLAEFQAATTALGNEDIMDVPPVLGDANKTETDAYSVLWNAMLLEKEAIYALENFGVALATQQGVYDKLKAVYENEVTLLDEAQGVVASKLDLKNTAAGSQNTAEGNVDIAWIELGEDVTGTAGVDLKTPNTLNNIVFNAEVTLANAQSVTVTGLATLQADLVVLEHDLQELETSLGLAGPALVDAKAQLVILEAALEAAIAGGEAATTALIAIDNAIAALESQQYGHEVMNSQHALVAIALELGAVDQQALLKNANEAINGNNEAGAAFVNGLVNDIIAQQEVIALGVISADTNAAFIVRLEAGIDHLQAQIDVWSAIAADFLALVEEALQP